MEVPPIPGTGESRLDALLGLFEAAGLEAIRGRSFDVTVAFADFDEFWRSQTPAYHPMTKAIAGMSRRDRARLIESLRAILSVRDGAPVAYAARANAVRASASA